MPFDHVGDQALQALGITAYFDSIVAHAQALSNCLHLNRANLHNRYTHKLTGTHALHVRRSTSFRAAKTFIVFSCSVRGSHNRRVLSITLKLRRMESKLMTPTVFGQGHRSKDPVDKRWLRMLLFFSQTAAKPSKAMASGTLLPFRGMPSPNCSAGSLPLATSQMLIRMAPTASNAKC